MVHFFFRDIFVPNCCKQSTFVRNRYFCYVCAENRRWKFIFFSSSLSAIAGFWLLTTTAGVRERSLWSKSKCPLLNLASRLQTTHYSYGAIFIKAYSLKKKTYKNTLVDHFLLMKQSMLLSYTYKHTFVCLHTHYLWYWTFLTIKYSLFPSYFYI